MPFSSVLTNSLPASPAVAGASNTQWDTEGLCDDLSLFAEACQVPEVGTPPVYLLHACFTPGGGKVTGVRGLLV